MCFIYVSNPNNLYIYFKLMHVIHSFIIYSLFAYLLPYLLDFVQLIYYMDSFQMRANVILFYFVRL